MPRAVLYDGKVFEKQILCTGVIIIIIIIKLTIKLVIKASTGVRGIMILLNCLRRTKRGVLHECKFLEKIWDYNFVFLNKITYFIWKWFPH